MACPICNRPTDAAYRPFCSRRCADVDLGRWLTGSYVIPGPEEDEVPDATPRNPGDDDDPLSPKGTQRH